MRHSSLKLAGVLSIQWISSGLGKEDQIVLEHDQEDIHKTRDIETRSSPDHGEFNLTKTQDDFQQLFDRGFLKRQDGGKTKVSRGLKGANDAKRELIQRKKTANARPAQKTATTGKPGQKQARTGRTGTIRAGDPSQVGNAARNGFFHDDYGYDDYAYDDYAYGGYAYTSSADYGFIDPYAAYGGGPSGYAYQDPYAIDDAYFYGYDDPFVYAYDDPYTDLYAYDYYDYGHGHGNNHVHHNNGKGKGKGKGKKSKKKSKSKKGKGKGKGKGKSKKGKSKSVDYHHHGYDDDYFYLDDPTYHYDDYYHHDTIDDLYYGIDDFFLVDPRDHLYAYQDPYYDVLDPYYPFSSSSESDDDDEDDDDEDDDDEDDDEGDDDSSGYDGSRTAFTFVTFQDSRGLQPPIYVGSKTKDSYLPGTKYLFNREPLRDPFVLTGSKDGSVSGTCVRTDPYPPFSYDYHGLGYCQFTYEIFSDDGITVIGTITAEGSVANGLVSDLVVTGGTGVFRRVVGQLDLYPSVIDYSRRSPAPVIDDGLDFLDALEGYQVYGYIYVDPLVALKAYS